MSAGRAMKRRRQVFGVALLLAAVVLLIVALWSHVRRLGYVVVLLGGIGVWLVSRDD